MTTKPLLTLIVAGLFSMGVLADDDCTKTCTEEFEQCKAVAESSTAKAACEDDVKECKAQCGQ